jgi:hypothetical protein
MREAFAAFLGRPAIPLSGQSATFNPGIMLEHGSASVRFNKSCPAWNETSGPINLWRSLRYTGLRCS